jgi:hypothetical protein
MLHVSRIQSTSFLNLGYYVMKWEPVRQGDSVGVLSMFDNEGRIFPGVDDILNVPHLFNYNLNQQE